MTACCDSLQKLLKVLAGVEVSPFVWEIIEFWNNDLDLKNLFRKAQYFNCDDESRVEMIAKVLLIKTDTKAKLSDSEIEGWFELIASEEELRNKRCPGYPMALTLALAEYFDDKFLFKPEVAHAKFRELFGRLIFVHATAPERPPANYSIRRAFEGKAGPLIKRAAQFHMGDRLSDFLTVVETRWTNLRRQKEHFELSQTGQFILEQIIYGCFGSLSLSDKVRLLDVPGVTIKQPEQPSVLG